MWRVKGSALSKLPSFMVDLSRQPPKRPSSSAGKRQPSDQVEFIADIQTKPRPQSSLSKDSGVSYHDDTSLDDIWDLVATANAPKAAPFTPYPTWDEPAPDMLEEPNLITMDDTDSKAEDDPQSDDKGRQNPPLQDTDPNSPTYRISQTSCEATSEPLCAHDRPYLYKSEPPGLDAQIECTHCKARAPPQSDAIKLVGLDTTNSKHPDLNPTDANPPDAKSSEEALSPKILKKHKPMCGKNQPQKRAKANPKGKNADLQENASPGEADDEVPVQEEAGQKRASGAVQEGSSKKQKVTEPQALTHSSAASPSM